MAERWVESQSDALFQAAYVLEQMAFGLFSMFIFLFFGVVFTLYGLAVALSSVYPKWLGWAALALGIAGVLIGLIQTYQGPTDVVTNVLFPIVATLLTLWGIIVGILMWRKTTAAA